MKRRRVKRTDGGVQMNGLGKITTLLGAGLLSACVNVQTTTLAAADTAAGQAASVAAENDFQLAQATLAQHIRILSADEFAGREPGTEGGRLTQAYIIAALQSYGFQPGASETSYRQPVTLERNGAGEARATLVRGTRRAEMTGGDIRASGGSFDLTDVAVTQLASGDAIDAGALAGRAVLMQAGDARALLGQVMPAQPAAVVLVAASDAEFRQYAGFLSGGRWRLQGGEGAQPPILLIHTDVMEELAGDGELSLTAQNAAELEVRQTANVIGRLPGRVPGSGAVLMLAHWDHIGSNCAEEGAADQICNGAADNASGTGVMLETARRIAAGGGLDRDLYIMGTTAEELGLLGANAFAADPPLPLSEIVAAFNTDTVAIAPRGSRVTVVGWGRTPLDEGIRTVVEGLGLPFEPDEYTDQFVNRQDGAALLTRGVPTVLVSSSFGDRERFDDFLSGPYHQADDEWSEDMELGGATDDIFTHVALLRHFGSVERYTPPAPGVPENAGE